MDVKEGAIIGLVDGNLQSSGPDEDSVLREVLGHMAIDGCDIVTVYYGADVKLEQAAETAHRIRHAYPNVEVEVVEGGQAHYYYILGAE